MSWHSHPTFDFLAQLNWVRISSSSRAAQWHPYHLILRGSTSLTHTEYGDNTYYTGMIRYNTLSRIPIHGSGQPYKHACVHAFDAQMCSCLGAQGQRILTASACSLHPMQRDCCPARCGLCLPSLVGWCRAAQSPALVHSVHQAALSHACSPSSPLDHGCNPQSRAHTLAHSWATPPLTTYAGPVPCTHRLLLLAAYPGAAPAPQALLPPNPYAYPPPASAPPAAYPYAAPPPAAYAPPPGSAAPPAAYTLPPGSAAPPVAASPYAPLPPGSAPMPSPYAPPAQPYLAPPAVAPAPSANPGAAPAAYPGGAMMPHAAQQPLPGSMPAALGGAAAPPPASPASQPPASPAYAFGQSTGACSQRPGRGGTGHCAGTSML